MEDPIVLGLTQHQRREISDLNKRVVAVFQVHGADAPTAFTVLMNVLGSLLATQFNEPQRADRIAQAQTYLPMYVQAYLVKEKKL